MRVSMRIPTSALILLLSAVGLCYPQTTALETHTIALEYAVQGKFEEARQEFEKALRVDPFFESARTALGLIEDVADHKITRETAIHHFKADGFIIKGQWDQAIAECNKAIEINPRFAIGYIDRGFAYVGKREYDQAISDFNKAIEIEPMLPGFYLSRGLVYSHRGEYDQAISDFNKAIDLNPKEAMGYFSRGLAYYSKGEYDQAISDFNKAINLNPKEATFYNNRGFAWYQKGEYERAVADYTKALALAPGEPLEFSTETDTLDTLDRKKKVFPEDGHKRLPRSDTIKVPVANIRARPTTGSSIIAKLKIGTEVTLIHQEDEWYAVKFLGKQLGWAHQSLFLKLTEASCSEEGRRP